MVVDDTAVTPQFLEGSAAERELPIIKQIAIGSLRNKLLFILPAALILERVRAVAAADPADLRWHVPGLRGRARRSGEDQRPRRAGRGGGAELSEKGVMTPEHEKATVASAIRTDFILSAEIMVIALKEVVDSSPDAGSSGCAAILIVVALFITVAVYGFVALLVKMDDVGVHLATKDSSFSQQRRLRAWSTACRKVLAVISVIGTAAMLWVGGHILLISLGRAGSEASLSGTPSPTSCTRRTSWVHHSRRTSTTPVGSVGSSPGGCQHRALGRRRHRRRRDRGGRHARAAGIGATTTATRRRQPGSR